jgi:flagellar biosynthetic protein FliQ
MDEAVLQDALRQALWVSVEIAWPLLAVALGAGLAIGLLQALTSVQEMTLTFVPKVAAMLAVFWITAGAMTATLVRFFTDGIVPLVAGGR